MVVLTDSGYNPSESTHNQVGEALFRPKKYSLHAFCFLFRMWYGVRNFAAIIIGVFPLRTRKMLNLPA